MPQITTLVLSGPLLSIYFATTLMQPGDPVGAAGNFTDLQVSAMLTTLTLLKHMQSAANDYSLWACCRPTWRAVQDGFQP